MSPSIGIIAMKTRHIILLTAIAAALAAGSPTLFEHEADAQTPAAPLPSGGALSTLPHGTYQCALPGDASGQAFDVIEAENFRIGHASKYRNDVGTGTYLLRGKELIFTRGPKKGERFTRIGTNQVRKLDGDTVTKLLCTRLGSVG